VAQEWAERRRLDVSPTAGPGDTGPAFSTGLRNVSERFGRLFLARLWENPSWRKRWALRWRSETAVREIATGLGWDVAAQLRTVLPVESLAVTIKYALLGEFLQQRLRDRENRTPDQPDDGDGHFFVGIVPAIEVALTWLILHYPDQAAATIGETIGQAEDDLNISRPDAAQALRTAVSLQSEPDTNQELTDFLDKILSPILASHT
jgi:hypothetical protein